MSNIIVKSKGFDHWFGLSLKEESKWEIFKEYLKTVSLLRSHIYYGPKHGWRRVEMLLKYYWIEENLVIICWRESDDEIHELTELKMFAVFFTAKNVRDWNGPQWSLRFVECRKRKDFCKSFIQNFNLTALSL